MPKLEVIAERCKFCKHCERVIVTKEDGSISRNGTHQCMVNPNRPKTVTLNKLGCGMFEKTNG